VIEGELKVNGESLVAGDSAAVTKTNSLTLAAVKPAHFLFFDLN